MLRLVPVVLIFFIPALMGVATWKEKGRGYKVKAALWFGLGFGIIAAIQVLFRSVSAVQILGTLGLALVEIALALALAALVVYRLAD